MSVEEKQTCNMHTKEKENSGTCCQTKVTEEPGPEPKSVSQLLQEGMELQRRLEDE
jgi:hypothetical protein